MYLYQNIVLSTSDWRAKDVQIVFESSQLDNYDPE